MAISSTKYVGVLSDAGTAQVGLVSFANAGLVITGSTMGTTSDQSLSKKRKEYEEDGAIVDLSESEVSALFGENSPEFHFAVGYFGYVAPNGMFPEILYFKKCRSTDLAEEAADAMAQPVDFGSFTFLSVPEGSTDDVEQLKAVASANSASESRKMFVINWKKNPADDDDIEKVTDFSINELGNIRGCCLLYGATDWSAFMPMAVMAAQNIITSGVLQFMFNRFVKPTDEDVPTVTSDSAYNALSKANVNFLGRTQVNGQELDFFQRGYATNGEDLTLQMAMNWIEQQTRAAIMNLFINNVMPANNDSVIAVGSVLGNVMISARDSGIVVQLDEITDAIHKTVSKEIVNKMGGTLDVVDRIEAGLTTNGYGYYVKLNGIKNLGDISGGHSEPSISYKVLYSYAGAIRFIGGEYKVVP